MKGNNIEGGFKADRTEVSVQLLSHKLPVRSWSSYETTGQPSPLLPRAPLPQDLSLLGPPTEQGSSTSHPPLSRTHTLDSPVP